MTFKHEASRPSATWILVADRARARVFVGEWPELDDFHEIEDFVHPEGGAHQRDLESEEAGRFQRYGGARSSAESETDFKHRTAKEFARELVAKLQHGKDDNAFGRLVIVSPALFLGVLRELLPTPLSKLVVTYVNKDLTQHDSNTLRAEILNLATPQANKLGGRT